MNELWWNHIFGTMGWGCCWMGWLLTASKEMTVGHQDPSGHSVLWNAIAFERPEAANERWFKWCNGLAHYLLVSLANVSLWKNGTLKSFKIQCFFYNISPEKTVILSHTPFLKIHSMCSQIWTLWVLHLQKTPGQRSPAWDILMYFVDTETHIVHT